MCSSIHKDRQGGHLSMNTQECTSSFSAEPQTAESSIHCSTLCVFYAGAGIQRAMLNYDINLFLTQQPSHKMLPISESIGVFVLQSGSSLLVWTGWLLLSPVPPSGIALFDLPAGSHCTATNPSTPTNNSLNSVSEKLALDHCLCSPT